MTYHVVCHDCVVDYYLLNEEIAESQVKLHKESVGHDVEYAEEHPYDARVEAENKINEVNNND